MSMMMTKLPGCPMCSGRGGPPCDRCQRLAAIGLIVDAFVPLPYAVPGGVGVVPGPLWLGCLDAVAFLLLDRAKLRKAMNDAIWDEQRAAQQDAREAHDEGFRQGANSRDEW